MISFWPDYPIEVKCKGQFLAKRGQMRYHTQHVNCEREAYFESEKFSLLYTYLDYAILMLFISYPKRGKM